MAKQERLANIMPHELISKLWRITYDLHGGMNSGHFVVHTDHCNIVVKKNEKGMPYIDLAGVDEEVALDFVKTVQGNMEGFTCCEVEEARAAREAQGMVGHPTDRDFLEMVRANYIMNCPVTESAVQNANLIFGPDLAGVRRRTVHRPPEAVPTDFVHIPWIFLDRHQVVVLTADVMFVNGVPILVSLARGLNLLTCEFLPVQTVKSLASCIDQIKHLYRHGGFTVGTILMDNKFEKVRPLVLNLHINTTAAKEHVPEIERRIRLVKERGRGYLLNTLPFKKMPQLILIELISYHAVLWLNAFPSKSGISQTLSPCKTVLRHRLDLKKHCRAPFGSYCKAPDKQHVIPRHASNRTWPHGEFTRHLCFLIWKLAKKSNGGSSPPA